MSENQNEDELIARGGGSKSKIYGPDTQILVIGVHGTKNAPGNVADVANKIGFAYESTHKFGNVVRNNSFSWEENSSQFNGPDGHRKTASDTLTVHTLDALKDAYQKGELDRNKPLVINLVGFSHGGNVGFQASDDIAHGIKQMKANGDLPKDLPVAIHHTTLSTPGYNDKDSVENPVNAKKATNAEGVGFAHTAFSVKGDQVIGWAGGEAKFNNSFTANKPLPQAYESPFGDSKLGTGIANHGAPQDLEHYKNIIAGDMVQRFKDLAPSGQKRADAQDGTDLANATQPLVPGNDRINRNFEQALIGTPSPASAIRPGSRKTRTSASSKARTGA
jgi:hypothetical protein